MTETPDLPCPKCGSQRTEMVYCNRYAAMMRNAEQTRAAGLRVLSVPAKYKDGTGQTHLCLGPDREHFHRGCLRCEYRWITEDVVTG